MRDERFIVKDYYIRPDSFFFEPLEQWYVPDTHFMRIVEDCLSKHGQRDAWNLHRNGAWFHTGPKGITLPSQGWKIHVSAQLDRAEYILSTVADILILESVSFKWALDKTVYTIMLDKRWPRGGSGKFITIYPNTTDQFHKLIRVLYTLLRDEEGPYILSDRRYKDCRVLHYRYGGFLPMSIVTITGERRPIIRSPADDPVFDRRAPYFILPDWVSDHLAENERELTAHSSTDGRIELNKRYYVERAMHFSNAGGVYLAEDTWTKRRVVVKEARPHTCVDFLGNDAVSLRHREWEILCLLENTGLVPQPIDLFHEWEHCFLVESYEEGKDIREILLKYNPLTRVNPSLADSARYYDIYRRLFLSLVDGIETIHKQGIVYGDLSANNLLVTDDYQVRFLDLEAAFRVGVDQPTNLFTYGFRDPRRVIKGEQSFKDDLYTIGTLMTYMLFPVTAMGNLRKDVYSGPVHKLTRDLGWPAAIPALIGRLVEGGASYDDVRASLGRSWKPRRPSSVGTMTPAEIEQIVGSLADFIHKSMREDDYQLCPGDPFVFLTNPLGLSSGAIGVLYSLKKCKRDIPRMAWEYLDAKLSSVEPFTYPPGLLTGMGGIAWGAWELGREAEATRLIKLANTHPLLKAHHSLFYGMAGVGLSNLYFYRRTGKSEFLDLAEGLAKELLATALQDGPDIFWKTDGKIHVGLGYGQAGVALFLLRLSQATGNQMWRAIGLQALNYDYRCGREIENGVVSFPGKPGALTLEPYLEEGTAGMVKVLLRYGMVEEAERLSADLWRKHCISASYLFGLGGLVDSLVDMHAWTGDDKYLRLAQRPLAGLKDLYLIKTKQGLATPGDGGMAISCDFGTGVAGVMRVLHRHLTQDDSDFMLDELELERRQSVWAN